MDGDKDFDMGLRVVVHLSCKTVKVLAWESACQGKEDFTIREAVQGCQLRRVNIDPILLMDDREQLSIEIFVRCVGWNMFPLDNKITLATPLFTLGC